MSTFSLVFFTENTKYLTGDVLNKTEGVKQNIQHPGVFRVWGHAVIKNK